MNQPFTFQRNNHNHEITAGSVRPRFFSFDAFRAELRLPLQASCAILDAGPAGDYPPALASIHEVLQVLECFADNLERIFDNF